MSKNLETVMKYYALADATSPDITDLFVEDFEFHFPKFGVGRGKADFYELAQSLWQKIQDVHHDIDKFKIIDADDRICVEGTSRGFAQDGGAWQGGETPGGRFCSVFEFEGDLIKRMFVYLDPDYGGADTDRLIHNRAHPKW